MSKSKIILIVSIIIILLLGGAATFYFLHSKKSTSNSTQQTTQTQPVSVLDQAKNTQLNSYSVQGTVISISGNTVTFSTSILQNGQPVSQNKSFTLSSKLPIRFQTGTKETVAKTTDIKVNSSIIVETRAYPFDESDLDKTVIYQINILK